MNKVVYVWEVKGNDYGADGPRVVHELDEIPAHVERVGVYQRTGYLRRGSKWKETT